MRPWLGHLASRSGGWGPVGQTTQTIKGRKHKKKHDASTLDRYFIGRTVPTFSFAMMRRNWTTPSGLELVTNAYWEADPHPGTPVFKYPACSAYVGCTRGVVCSSRVPRRGQGMREGDKSSNGRWVESRRTQFRCWGEGARLTRSTFSARRHQRINRSSDNVFRRLPELSIRRSQIAVASWKHIRTRVF